MKVAQRTKERVQVFSHASSMLPMLFMGDVSYSVEWVSEQRERMREAKIWIKKKNARKSSRYRRRIYIYRKERERKDKRGGEGNGERQKERKREIERQRYRVEDKGREESTIGRQTMATGEKSRPT